MEVASDAQLSSQISALLNPPCRPQVQEYFEALVADRQSPGLKVKADGEHGKGVYSEVNFQEGDLVLKDGMLVGVQHSSNKIDCLVCSFCFRFIGSIGLQIGRKLYLEELGISSSDHCGSTYNSSSGKSHISGVTIQSLMEGTLNLPYSEKFPLPEVVSCPGKCNEAYYCSKSCAEADWDASHSLLCTGHGSSSQKTTSLLKFIKHANETNDIFILAAKVISFTILRYRRLKAARVQQNGKHKSFNLSNDILFTLLLKAWMPFSMGYKKRWWECIARPEDVDICEESNFRMQIKNLASESLQLLTEAIYDEECAPLFSLDVYGHIIGMFELNNLDLVVESPVENYFLYVDDLPSSQKKEVEKVTKPLLDALGEDYSVPCQGTAFYPLQSCMNHSCVPNAKAFKRDEDTDGQATIVATRLISRGEEIRISYVDEELPYDERQEALADYGFVCECPKCRAQRKTRR